jgi:hypothetical protein
MKLKGVCYDVGSVMYFNWRPDFDPVSVGREIEIIRSDLHCNAIRISGLDLNRLKIASTIALKEGLEVWLSPQLWNKGQAETLAYILKAAKLAEELNREYSDRVVLSVGSEVTLFMRGIVEGRNVTERMAGLMTKFRSDQKEGQRVNFSEISSRLKAAEHTKLLDNYLRQVASSVRQVFHGKITYASLVWESVDWNLFDYIGVDHYRVERIKDQYVEMLKPFFEYGKPVAITEFGVLTYQGAEINGAGLGGNIIDNKSQFFHTLPLLGRFVRPKIVGSHIRDEGLQARELIDQLRVLDSAGVYGAFVSGFVSQITPYDDNPKYDLDMGSMSLVKTFSKGKHGTTYPDMTWEPKESFRAVAEYYTNH